MHNLQNDNNNSQNNPHNRNIIRLPWQSALFAILYGEHLEWVPIIHIFVNIKLQKHFRKLRYIDNFLHHA